MDQLQTQYTKLLAEQNANIEKSLLNTKSDFKLQLEKEKVGFSSTKNDHFVLQSHKYPYSYMLSQDRYLFKHVVYWLKDND